MAGDRLICLVSKTALTRTVLSLVIFVILTFLAVEVKRIMNLNELYAHELKSVDLQDEPITLSQRESPMPTAETLNHVRWDSEIKNILQMNEPLCEWNLLLLVLVVSAPANFDKRQAIRESWNDLSSSPKVKVVFLTGKTGNNFLNAMVCNEFKNFGDILIGDYKDTYRNLTAKVLYGFVWARRSCRARFVLKTDDDCFVNLPFLVRFLENLSDFRDGGKDLYVGRVRKKSSVVRNKNSRWYVSRREHVAPCYAHYASGAGYILSWDILVKLVQSSVDVAQFPNEDAYVGEVLHRARVAPTNSGRFVISGGNVWSWKPCNYSYLFVIHPVKTYEHRKLQNNVENALVQCPLLDELESWT